MDPIEQHLARFKQPAIALAGGFAAALVVATLPHVYLENIVGATGLSEIIPAAAPPLGNTARGLIAIAAGMITASALYIVLNRKSESIEGGSDMSLAIRKNLTPEPVAEEVESKSRFAMPKLNLSARSFTKYLKKPKKSKKPVTDLLDLPDVRTEDSHPDAPVRQPIFAVSDLGAPLVEKIQKFDPSDSEPECEVQSEAPAAPAMATAPVVTDEPLTPAEPQAPRSLRDEPPARQQLPAAPADDLAGLSIAQLADRLETGLARLNALERGESITEAANGAEVSAILDAPEPEMEEEPAPVAMPPLRSVESDETPPVHSRQADMDAALKAALGTLEKMTAQR